MSDRVRGPLVDEWIGGALIGFGRSARIAAVDRISNTRRLLISRDYVSNMTVDLETVADTLATGDSEETNRVIDALDDLDAIDRHRVYDDLLDKCCRVFEESDDGYVRQSVVRALRDGYPRLESRIGAPDLGTDTTVDRTQAGPDTIDGVSIDDTAAYRERYVTLLLDALDDEDGRVRSAAADAFTPLGTGLNLAGLEAEQERVLADLEALSESQPDERRKHTEEAVESIERFGSGGVLDGILSKASDRNR